jgi:ubiquinone biosynthesis protein
MLLNTLSTARDLARLQEMAGVFIRHGLGDLVRRLGWADALDKAGQALRWEHAADLARLSPPEQLRCALEELGPTFVKLGQVLAGRADLFGPEWIAQFEQLHSHAPPADAQALRVQLIEDLGAPPEDVFAQWDPQPLAAASIAQVHAATLGDGTDVVVKVRRPGIRALIDADLRLLERLAAMAEREWPDLQPYGPVGLVRQFGRSLRRELDLAAECRHAERVAANFVNLPEVVIPRVYWDWTGERVNVQQRIRGVAGPDLARLAAAGLDRRLLAQRGANAVLKMIVQDGFFHADPHPGNVFYLPGNRLAFIDFGMVGRLGPERRDQLLRLMLGLVQRQPQAVADVLLDWAGDAQLDEAALLEDIDGFVDQYHGVPLAKLQLGQMLADVTGILLSHHLTLPSDLALLIKAFITLEGMGRALDPEFHMADQALPLLRAAVRERYRPRALADRATRVLQQGLALASGIPNDLMRLLRAARRGRLQLHIDVAHIRELGDRLDRAASRVAISLVVAALIVGSSIVMTVGGGPTLLGLPAFGLLGFVAAVGGALWLLGSIARSGRTDADGPGEG